MMQISILQVLAWQSLSYTMACGSPAIFLKGSEYDLTKSAILSSVAITTSWPLQAASTDMTASSRPTQKDLHAAVHVLLCQQQRGMHGSSICARQHCGDVHLDASSRPRAMYGCTSPRVPLVAMQIFMLDNQSRHRPSRQDRRLTDECVRHDNAPCHRQMAVAMCVPCGSIQKLVVTSGSDSCSHSPMGAYLKA